MSLGESSSVLSEDTNLPLVRPQKHTCETDEEPEAAHTKKRARIDQLITVTEPATDEAVEAIPDIPRHPSPEREPMPLPCTNEPATDEAIPDIPRHPLPDLCEPTPPARTDEPATNEAIPDIPRHPSPEREPTPPQCTDKGKDKEVATVEIKNPLSNLVSKPRPKPITRKLVDSVTTSTSGTNPTVLVPPSNAPSTPSTPSIRAPSNTDGTASLAIKMELLAANPVKSMPITINSKAQPIKKRQPSTKPMRVTAKITARRVSFVIAISFTGSCSYYSRNLCALDWQMSGHQREPASAFATYWNGLSSADKEVYKRKAVLQLNSSGAIQGSGTGDDADE